MDGVTSKRIFLSYRREDTRHVAGRLFDRLAERFGSGNVFMDVDSIEPGLDFGDAIEHAIAQCQIVLVLIGPEWTGVVDHEGSRRLDDPDDLVVLEVMAALQRDIRVIPVLVDGAAAPRRADLPPILAPLARRNAVRLDHETFRSDVGVLLETLETVLPSPVADHRGADVAAPKDLEPAAPAEPAGAGSSPVAGTRSRVPDDPEQLSHDVPRRAVAALAVAYVGYALSIDEPGIPSAIVGWTVAAAAVAGLVLSYVDRRRDRQWVIAVALGCAWFLIGGVGLATLGTIRAAATLNLLVGVSSLLLFLANGGIVVLTGWMPTRRTPRRASLLFWTGTSGAGLVATYASARSGNASAARGFAIIVLFVVGITLVVVAARGDRPAGRRRGLTGGFPPGTRLLAGVAVGTAVSGVALFALSPVATLTASDTVTGGLILVGAVAVWIVSRRPGPVTVRPEQGREPEAPPAIPTISAAAALAVHLVIAVAITTEVRDGLALGLLWTALAVSLLGCLAAWFERRRDPSWVRAVVANLVWLLLLLSAQLFLAAGDAALAALELVATNAVLTVLAAGEARRRPTRPRRWILPVATGLATVLVAALTLRALVS